MKNLTYFRKPMETGWIRACRYIQFQVKSL